MFMNGYSVEDTWLRTLAERFGRDGLDVREYENNGQLREIRVTSDATAKSSQVTIGSDGYLTWELSVPFKCEADVNTARDLIFRLLTDSDLVPLESG